MLVLLIVIFLSLGLFGLYLYKKRPIAERDVHGVVMFVGFVATLILLIVVFSKINDILNLKIIDSKIDMYNQENQKIEKDISMICKTYQQHEQKTFNLSEISSPTVLVQMYPKLESHKLAAKQIDVYYNNNKKIKSLREEGIEYRKAKWWLYFGSVSE